MVNLGIGLMAGKRSEEAREVLLRAVGADPKNATAHYNLGLLYEDAKEYARAIQELEAFLKNPGPEQVKLANDVRAHLLDLRQRIIG
jgi:tetratricopeptide (TPR) repeat protein